MCVVSMIGDHYTDKWRPYTVPYTNPVITVTKFPEVTSQEFQDLKKEVLEMKELLKKAIQYDKDHNEPHCEIEDKVKTLKAMAEAMGVSLEDVFPPIEPTNMCSGFDM